MVRGGWHNVTFKELYWFNEQNFPLSRQKAAGGTGKKYPASVNFLRYKKTIRNEMEFDR